MGQGGGWPGSEEERRIDALQLKGQVGFQKATAVELLLPTLPARHLLLCVEMNQGSAAVFFSPVAQGQGEV